MRRLDIYVELFRDSRCPSKDKKNDLRVAVLCRVSWCNGLTRYTYIGSPMFVILATVSRNELV